MSIKKLLIGIMFFLGLCIFFYPVCLQHMFSKNTEKIMERYTISEPTHIEQLYLELMKYNEHLYETHQSALKDPWSYEQEGFDLKKYGLDTNMIAIVNIDAIDIHLPIYLGASTENMENGIALLTQTSIPIGGINTNAVLCGHRGMVKARMFRDIDALQLNEIVEIQNFKERLVYQVKKKEIIHPNEIDKILIQEGKDMVTLLSCEGQGDTYRYVVYCERVK